MVWSWCSKQDSEMYYKLKRISSFFMHWQCRYAATSPSSEMRASASDQPQRGGCPPPPVIDNGFFNPRKTTYKVKEKVAYGCLNGYRYSGKLKLICTEKGIGIATHLSATRRSSENRTAPNVDGML
eukprot:m.282443 g.282443  ORF g.282443 m.282443 type:complete len:126 (+) comp40653_c0_seq9:654-1031(+)